MAIGDLVNPNPSPDEQKAAGEVNLTEAIERLQEVLTERPDGMIPYERNALAAIERVEAESFNWKRAHGSIPDIPDASTLAAEAGGVGVDDVVALAEIIAAVIDRPLMPHESSKLKTAFQRARVTSTGATLDTINAQLVVR